MLICAGGGQAYLHAEEYHQPLLCDRYVPSFVVYLSWHGGTTPDPKTPHRWCHLLLDLLFFLGMMMMITPTKT